MAIIGSGKEWGMGEWSQNVNITKREEKKKMVWNTQSTRKDRKVVERVNYMKGE